MDISRLEIHIERRHRRTLQRALNDTTLSDPQRHASRQVHPEGTRILPCMRDEASHHKLRPRKRRHQGRTLFRDRIQNTTPQHIRRRMLHAQRYFRQVGRCLLNHQRTRIPTQPLHRQRPQQPYQDTTTRKPDIPARTLLEHTRG